jgi:hypothetical protein
MATTVVGAERLPVGLRHDFKMNMIEGALFALNFSMALREFLGHGLALRMGKVLGCV